LIPGNFDEILLNIHKDHPHTTLPIENGGNGKFEISNSCALVRTFEAHE
jgi:hypothetical protein